MANIGRPSKYTPEMALEILSRIAEGETLVDICKDDDKPSVRTVNEWALFPPADSPEALAFPLAFARARLLQREAWAEMAASVSFHPEYGTKTITRETNNGTYTETIEGDMVEHRRLKVNTLQWFLARLDRVKYGDKVDALLGSSQDGVVTVKIINDPDPNITKETK